MTASCLYCDHHEDEHVPGDRCIVDGCACGFFGRCDTQIDRAFNEWTDARRAERAAAERYWQMSRREP